MGRASTYLVSCCLQMVTAGADYLVASTQVKDGAATSFIARVGDPSLYIDRGVGEVDPGKRIWATPEEGLKQEMVKSKGRAAVVVDAKNLGEFLCGMGSRVCVCRQVLLAAMRDSDLLIAA